MKNLEALREECEIKFGRKIVSPSDFDLLFLDIKKVTGKEISVSSLKRIWGYVKYPHVPTNTILSILAEYSGYKDWHEFRSSEEIAVSSDFLGDNIIKSSSLQPGDFLQLRWSPDRQCNVKYLGEERFEVVRSSNAKLKTGDTFRCSMFAKGEMMMCYDIWRGDRFLSSVYVAGRSGGLSEVEMV